MTPLEFLEAAILTPSPSGYEEPIQKLISKYLDQHTDLFVERLLGVVDTA